ncbi:MAG TPA: glutamate cyclase domain-containing protein [bacterium]|nr:glutamate cyclase domain-containing protein [bacterium]
MALTAPQRSIGEGIDRLVSVEITGRGVIGELYAAARRGKETPLCLEAASTLLGRMHKGSVVVLATGLPTYPWFAGEQDGPVGTATLARALVLAVGARPVIVTDPVNVEICAAAVRGAGLYVRSMEDALRLPTTAAVLPFPLAWGEAGTRSEALLDTLRPSALIAIERPGANEHGQYHSAGGKSLTDHCGKIDALFQTAREREIPTIGIGDGGNELGCAAIREIVLRVVPNGARCTCPCGGTVVPKVSTDLFIAAAISNWGAYGIEAAMAILLERPEVMHTREIDARVHDLCAAAGANNDGPGLLDVGTDAVPAPLHGHIVDLLGQMVRSGIDFGRLYREPRYPWF